MFDAIVVGGGVAGLSAATWLGRYRRTAVVYDSGEYRNRWTQQAHGYLGFDPCDPADLLARGREHLGAYPSVAIREDRVTSIEPGPDGFVVTTGRDSERARRIILATGVEDAFPEIDGFFEHYGVDVFHCPACDAYEAREKDVVVLGWSRPVADFAIGLVNWARRVTVVTDGRRFEGDETCRSQLAQGDVTVVEQVAEAFVGSRGTLEAVQLRGGELLPCRMAFFSIAHRPHTTFAEMLGCRLDEDGYVDVDDQGRTTVDGVYACGDLTPGLHLLQVAAAKGAIAGVGCATSLIQTEVQGGRVTTPG